MCSVFVAKHSLASARLSRGVGVDKYESRSDTGIQNGLSTSLFDAEASRWINVRTDTTFLYKKKRIILMHPQLMMYGRDEKSRC